jgi:phosphatidylinositol 3-kinase
MVRGGRLLKKENLDLKLTPYGCLATSTEIGMMKCVVPSTPLASVFKTDRDIRTFLRKKVG